jgi:hypothetical protein
MSSFFLLLCILPHLGISATNQTIQVYQCNQHGENDLAKTPKTQGLTVLWMVHVHFHACLPEL